MRARTVRFSLLATAFACLILLGSVSGARAAEGVQTTLLLAPSGQPVGGVWQRWMNDSYMPTWQGTVTLNLGFDGACGTVSDAVGCTSGTFANPVSSVASEPPAREQQTLLYEQGHVIDGEYLTDTERLELITLWGRRVPAGETVDQYWWQGESGYFGQAVMGEWFSDDYSLCALHRDWSWALMDREHGNWPGADSYPVYGDARTVSLDESGPPRRWHNVLLPPSRQQSHWLRVQEESCSLIRYWIKAATGSTAGT